MRIICLSGKIGTGKTTVAAELMALLPGAVRIAFADPLKSEAAALFSFPEALCHSEAGKKVTVALSEEGAALMDRDTASVREVLQFLGTIRRKADPDYWHTKMARALDVLDANGVQTAIVDDARFPGEVDMLKQRGGELYRIEPYDGWQPGKNAGHISETALDNYDGWQAVFYPKKGKEQLQAVATQIVPRIGKSCATD